jgi:hypothetical protein
MFCVGQREAKSASFSRTRTPRDGLATQLPARAAPLVPLMQPMRGNDDNDTRFGPRVRGAGVFAPLLARRFQVATKRLGYAPRGSITLDTARFRHPDAPSPQGELFGD